MPFQINPNGDLIVEERLATGRLTLRSNEVSEILSHKPGFLVRWGTTLFFMVLVAIVAMCWFIKYPDIVGTKATLTSINTPKEIKTKTDGRLVKLLASEGSLVQPSDIIGWIESRAKHTQVIELSESLEVLQQQIKAGGEGLNNASFINQYANLGEIQPSFQTFMQAHQIFQQYLSSGYYPRKKAMLLKDVAYLQLLDSSLIQQQAMQKEDLQLTKETFAANEKLKNDKVISAFDYRNEKSKLIGKQLTLPQITSSIITNESNQHNKQKEIAELDNQIAQQRNLFIEALNTFKAQIDEWKAKYLLIAPIAGKLSFSTFLQENQQLQSNQSICFINPQNSSYYTTIFIPQGNFGKIKTGQKVLLKFAAYPFQEFGSVEAKLDFISPVPTDSGYLAKAMLPAGLKTNYDKELQFRDGLTAQAEIITNDMNLLQRFFYSVRGLSNK